MTGADLERLAELDRIYERVMEQATSQMMPVGTRLETAWRNGRGRRRHLRATGGRTVRQEVRAEAEAFMLALVERSEDPDARRFAELVRERDELRELRNLIAEATFDPATRRRMEKIVQKSKNGTAPPELVGAAEIADLIGVSRQRVHQLRGKEGFPKPVQVLRSGPVWTLADVKAWIRGRK